MATSGAAIHGRRTVTANPLCGWWIRPLMAATAETDIANARPLWRPRNSTIVGAYCEANPLAEGWRSRIHCIRSTRYSFTPCSSAAGIRVKPSWRPIMPSASPIPVLLTHPTPVVDCEITGGSSRERNVGMASVADEASSADGEHRGRFCRSRLGSMPTALVRNRTASATSKSALTVTGVRRRNAACTTST